jgi:hypothetical protein
LCVGDTFVFWKSDRWGRSAANVLTTVNELRDQDVKVVSLTGEPGNQATCEKRAPASRELRSVTVVMTKTSSLW